jgi:anti-sigma factor RsiW
MNAPASKRCRALLTRISRWVDGDVTGEERRALLLHLKQCPCCEDMATSLQRTVDVCHKAGRKRLPADVRDRARQRVIALLERGTSRG